MERHLVTAFILLVAVVLYSLGFTGSGTALIGIGGAFELWFWVRVLPPRQRPSRP
ncbi:hypothetical protein ACPWT1_08125 [Ramlibacter sp. MMS24-I3-19]|uniref:hypothetical protein n=1 Tax=Ramlibacter sp. MMS24-I3-19 TaxID=3416606 RepID=UPI003CFD762F